ncbi:biotin carboxyl carrier protein [Singulisphaera sp. GP187]|uniref:acetyl-CoA carboxylase biotin carboxyl carrier protein n=1 Tax=Singulisphaera sp. GP187 TaxID=1882752 RepID=UPI00092680CC|nr:acetyl-CoA carboxylase biotin carboxyl carrier protein [Singulisphaera sp. GP187]SIO33250.1 biotin carboxyl carrier protein [Singulisphaera sp. GP187]
MPEKPTEPTPPFDVHVIHQLVRLMKRYDLMAIDLVEGPTKIRLRRRNETPVPAAAAPGLYAAPPPTAPPPPRIESTPAAPPVSDDAVIKSPMVGTYYASSSPDAPPFVTVGTNIRPDSTVCVIEAMKVFTDIPAGLSGKVTEVLVKNGQSVEFGQPMFRVQPA